jgi:hypothetical protein
MKKKEIRENVRMRQLAGLLTESQIRRISSILNENDNNNSFNNIEDLTLGIKKLGDFGFTGDEITIGRLLITSSTQEDETGTPYYFVYGEDDEDEIFSSTDARKVAKFVFNYL